MKQLLLIRHAKSSWDDLSLDDLDRPLNKRGKREATLLGQYLKRNSINPQMIFSSPAKRAYKTAKRISNELGFQKKMIKIDKIIYSGSKSDLVELIGSIDKKIDHVFIIGHYPSLMELGNYLTASNFDKMLTCGFILIDFKTKFWEDIGHMRGNIVLIDRVR